jgi:hypothetical protein
MKRPKAFRHRPGMRFDRSHVQGPDAAFLGSDITVISATTGSVERSMTERSGDFRYPSVPFAGYPTSAGDMQTATAGYGTWTEGWLLDESTGTLSPVFSSLSFATMTITSSGSLNTSYRAALGPRGAGDYAMGFTNGGQDTYAFIMGGGTKYSSVVSSSIVALWVGNTIGNEPYILPPSTQVSGGCMFFTGDPSAPNGGWSLTNQVIFSPLTATLTLELTPNGGNNQTVSLRDAYIRGNWHVGIAVIDRNSVNQKLFIATRDIATGQFASTSGTIASSVITASYGGPLIFGGKSTTSPRVPPNNLSLSAIYFASGTNAASGVIDNYQTVLTTFTTILTAKNGFLFSGSTDVQDSIASWGSVDETTFLNQKLLGLGTASLSRPRGLLTSTTGTIPSWTNVHIKNQAFVVTVLSSSNHESQVLNYYVSGTGPLETTAVPASATLYYSKRSVGYLTVKKTASFFDTVVPFSGVIVPSAFSTGTGSLITIVTGSNTPALSCSYRYPATIRVDVPQRGKLVDLKVWVEVIHHSASAGQNDPLGSMGIAIRSPNVRWDGHAHPVRNDPKFINAFRNPAFIQIAQLACSGVEDLYYPAARFYANSFLLWEGYAIHMYNGQERYSVGGSANTARQYYPCWNRDRHMRTIFADGAPIPNPRHLNGPVSGNFNGSPNGAMAWGNNVPWTTEAFGLAGEPTTFQAVGSPPAGWRSGAGGTNGVNEWPTTGSNIGAERMQPVYPLLDGIFQTKRIGNEYPLAGTIVKTINGIDIPQENPALWRGFRPGLRGTEISGTWEIMFAQCGALAGTGLDATEAARINSYFRQVRFEFVYELSEDPSDVRAPSLGKAHRKGDSLLNSISGTGQFGRDDLSGSFDAYVSDTYLDYRGSAETGRTFGVGLNTGSIPQNNYALIYRITGTLADISGSAPGWLTNNQFSMPSIPISSASLVPSVPQSIVSIHPQDILASRPLVDATQRLSDAARDAAAPMSRAEYAVELISGTLT